MQTVTFTQYISPICLPTIELEPAEGPLIISGWQRYKQRVLNYLQRTMLSCGRMIRLLVHPLPPPLPARICLSCRSSLVTGEGVFWLQEYGSEGKYLMDVPLLQGYGLSSLSTDPDLAFPKKAGSLSWSRIRRWILRLILNRL